MKQIRYYVCVYFQRKLRRAHPGIRFRIKGSRFGSFYIQYRKTGATNKKWHDIVRVANHSRRNHHGNIIKQPLMMGALKYDIIISGLKVKIYKARVIEL